MKLLKLVNNFCLTTTCSSNVFKSQDLSWKQVATHGSDRRAYSRAWPRWKGTTKEIKQAQGLADKDGISSHGLKDHGRGTVFPEPMSQAIAAGQGFVNKHSSSSSSRAFWWSPQRDLTVRESTWRSSQKSPSRLGEEWRRAEWIRKENEINNTLSTTSLDNLFFMKDIMQSRHSGSCL